MKTVLIVSDEFAFRTIAERILAPFFHVLAFNRMASALDFIFNEIPDIVIVEIVSGDEATVQRLSNVKEDPLFSQIPVIAVFREEPLAEAWESLLVEDYLRKDDLGRDLLLRVNLAVTRYTRVVEVNPLTRLPGNISINRQIQRRLDKGEGFAFAYADLSEFKPFNDRYGFSRGDEVLKITGRLILNIVKSKQPAGSFVGHIGGDDFVFIMEKSLIQEACRDVIKAFDNIILTFYDPQDRENNGIESVDRRGVLMSFPFISLAIGVTDTAGRSFTHFGQVTGAASEMKNLAKKKRDSSFSVDKRIVQPL
ncbi:MAG: diguanylate cyclase [Syntrophales bacterium]|jgi:diguanylate cyclase (GGDEF)-like protein|nr:diguanylate cyclase [Syntrophales bacterium]